MSATTQGAQDTTESRGKAMLEMHYSGAEQNPTSERLNRRSQKSLAWVRNRKERASSSNPCVAQREAVEDFP